MEASRGRHHEHSAVELHCDFAELDFTGRQIQSRRSDPISGDVDRQGLQKSADNDFDHEGPRLPRQRDAPEFLGLQFQNALITTKGTFRIGDSQFKLTGNGVAQINTIVTDPTTGTQTNDQATLTRKS